MARGNQLRVVMAEWPSCGFCTDYRAVGWVWGLGERWWLLGLRGHLWPHFSLGRSLLSLRISFWDLRRWTGNQTLRSKVLTMLSYLGTKGPPGKGPGSWGWGVEAGRGIRKHWLLTCPGVGWEVRVRPLGVGMYVVIRVTGQETPAFLILPLFSLTKQEGFTCVSACVCIGLAKKFFQVFRDLTEKTK